jgi:hypothetical protein
MCARHRRPTFFAARPRHQSVYFKHKVCILSTKCVFCTTYRLKNETSKLCHRCILRYGRSASPAMPPDRRSLPSASLTGTPYSRSCPWTCLSPQNASNRQIHHGQPDKRPARGAAGCRTLGGGVQRIASGFGEVFWDVLWAEHRLFLPSPSVRL